MMSARQTSIDAYRSLTDLPTRRAQVLAVLSRGPASNATIARTLNLPLHCVTGRVRELVDAGEVREYGRELDPVTGRRVIAWEVVE